MVKSWKETLIGGGIMAVGLSGAPATAAFSSLAGLAIGGPIFLGGLFGEETAKEAAGVAEEAMLRTRRLQ